MRRLRVFPRIRQPSELMYCGADYWMEYKIYFTVVKACGALDRKYLPPVRVVLVLLNHSTTLP